MTFFRVGWTFERRMLALLGIATAIGSLGLAAGGLTGSLLMTELTGSVAAAGLPLGLLVLASAVSAPFLSYISSLTRPGAGLAVGYAAGVLGALLAVLAAAVRSPGLLLAASLGLGIANAALFLTRYAAAAIYNPRSRGRALSIILFAASSGAIIGPNLLDPTKDLAHLLGLPPLSGLYLLAVPAFIVAGVLLAVFARRVHAESGLSSSPSAGVLRRVMPALRLPAVRNALLMLAVANLLMVGIMAIAPVQLTAHHHGFGLIGLVISVHIAAMFIPSPLVGWAADRFGGGAVASCGIVLLTAAGLAGAMGAEDSVFMLVLSLILLGLGWNAAIVGASTWLVQAAPEPLRSHMEGIGETAMGLAAAVGAPLAGLAATLGGFPALCGAGAALAVLTLLGVLCSRPRAAV